MHKRILLVDNEPEILMTIAESLIEDGYIVKTLTKGDKTLNTALAFQPDLILLDVRIGESDGRVICRRLKRSIATRHIPVVMVSAVLSVARDAKACGAEGFISKPFDILQLRASIRKVLG